MKIFGKKFFEKKENPVGPALVAYGVQKVGGAKEGQALIKEAYQRNVIVFRAIEEIAKGFASYKFDLHRGEEIILDHPILKLINRPNPRQGRADFLKQLATDYQLTGEMAFSKNGPFSSKEPRELWPQSPLEIKVTAGTSGLPADFTHEKNLVKTVWPVDQITGACDLFFMKTYDPLNYWRGQPPIRAAALAADAHNEGLNWNYNLMKNGARPAGAFKTPGSFPGAEQLANLRAFFRKFFFGSNNAGEPLILSGGLEFVPFEANAKDMDFILGMKEFSKYVSSAFGVPLPLIDNDAATMNNMEQAKERLHTDTILPFANLFLDALNPWLAFWYGEGLTLKVDEDAIPALEGVRQRKFERAAKAKDSNLITVNEAREDIGRDKYDPKGDDNADKLFINGGLIPLDMADAGYDPTTAIQPEDQLPDPNADPAPPKPEPKKPTVQ